MIHVTIKIFYYVNVLLFLFTMLIRPVWALENERLIGWKGEVSAANSNKHKVAVPELLSWEPRAFLFRDFLSLEECDYLVEKAGPSMAKSTVVDNGSGKSVPSSIRTSSGMFMRRAQDEIIEAIENRIAQASHIPPDHGEGLQILQYQIGQKYEAHYDYFSDRFNRKPEQGGQRIATMLMYLRSSDEGGETVFPASTEKPFRDGASAAGWSDCARRGVAAKPRKGDALLFWSLKPDGHEDSHSLHAGCPVLRGEKWSATKWMHVGKFLVESGPAHPPGECADYNDACAHWAESGECKNNPSYMVGSDGSTGECKKSCKSCKS